MSPITKKAQDALAKAFDFENKGLYEDAKLQFFIASREGTAAGTRGVERMLRKLKDHDIIDAAGIIRARREANTPIGKPRMTVPLSIPSEESRTLIDDRSTPKQKEEVQKDKKTAEQPKSEKGSGDNADKLLKRALESETRGNKKEAFQLLRKAADYGSEMAKAKIGQKYLKLAIRYLGREAAFEKLREKITPLQEEVKTDISTGDQLHFRHRRNRIAKLSGCGDPEETETSVLHPIKAEKKTWVGDEKKDSPPQPPQVIIQEVVRYVNYWLGNDCLPTMILIDRQEPVSGECSLQIGDEFCTEPIMWQEDFAESPAREEDAPQNEVKDVPDEEPKEDVCEHCRWGICTHFFKELFSILHK